MHPGPSTALTRARGTGMATELPHIYTVPARLRLQQLALYLDPVLELAERSSRIPYLQQQNSNPSRMNSRVINTCMRYR